MPVLTLTTANFRREVIDNAGPVIVDFYADWCGPCKQIAPAMEALSEKWEGQVRFAKVDIEAHPEIARGYNISSITRGSALRGRRGDQLEPGSQARLSHGARIGPDEKGSGSRGAPEEGLSRSIIRPFLGSQR